MLKRSSITPTVKQNYHHQHLHYSSLAMDQNGFVKDAVCI